jgi:DivIVA domain-containing protein
MGSALVYVIVVGLVAAAVYLVVAFVFGRGEELAPMPPGATPTRLPARDLTGGDVRDLRFQQALRGYKCSEVDWALARLAAEVDALRARVEAMEGAAAESPAAPHEPQPAPPAARVNGHTGREVDDPTPTDPTVRAERARGASSGPARGMSGVDGPRR